MMVWGVYSSVVEPPLNTGGRYNPGMDTWTATSIANVPVGRTYHTAIWSGSEMIVWGGYGGGVVFLNSGGKYCAQSSAPSPTPTATPCASAGTWAEQASYPIAVFGNAVASQGGNVYSFGGTVNNVAAANAYKYNPTTNVWTPIASLPEPG